MGGTAQRLEAERPSQYDQPSRVIECPSSVLQEIGATVLERFNSLPHGGSEIFGILLGTHNGAGVRITGFRALITEHEFARPGELSDEECLAFASAMPASSGETDASPEAAVGSFRSHPRSSLMLGERDLEIADIFFPQPWQVTLVLRPGNSAMTRGRIFFRKSAGPLAASAGFQEFTVDPPGIEIPRESSVLSAELLPAAVTPIQDALPRPDALSVLAAGAGSAEQPPESTPEEPHVPEALPVVTLRMTPGWATALRWPAALFSIAGLMAVLYWFGTTQGLGLRVFDNQGQLHTSSDRKIKPVGQGRNAHVEINNGAKTRVDLDREKRDGKVTDMRDSSNVPVRLVVPRAGAAPLEEAARLLGQVGQPVAVASAQAPLSGNALHAKSEQTSDISLAPRNTREMVVPVDPVAAGEPRPKFTAPSVVPETGAASKPALTDLTPPPVVARDNASAALPPSLHAQLAVEKLAPQQIPAASPPPPPLAPASSPAVSTLAVQNPVSPAPVTHLPAQPASGRVMWIGRLQKNQTLHIKGKYCSTGTLAGELPSRPIKFSVSPGDLSSDGIVLYTSNLQYANVVERPGAENGWNKTVFTWNPKFASDVIVEQAPSAQNGWNGVLRSRNPKISVIVIDWALVN